MSRAVLCAPDVPPVRCYETVSLSQPLEGLQFVKSTSNHQVTAFNCLCHFNKKKKKERRNNTVCFFGWSMISFMLRNLHVRLQVLDHALSGQGYERKNGTFLLNGLLWNETCTIWRGVDSFSNALKTGIICSCYCPPATFW